MPTSKSHGIAHVVFALPQMQHYDYIVTEPELWQQLKPGMRVKATFGRRYLIGMIVGKAQHSDCAPSKLKSIDALLDEEPLLSEELLTLITWAAGYYNHPLGMVLFSVLPTALKQGKTRHDVSELLWHLSLEGKTIDEAGLTRAPQQVRCIRLLKQSPLGHGSLKAHDIKRHTLITLRNKGWLVQKPASQPTPTLPKSRQPLPAIRLNQEQRTCINDFDKKGPGFHVSLLYGITGSGKTEIYMQLMRQVLAQKGQCLLLVPEISLTPQTIERFEKHFDVPIYIFHSGLTEKNRLNHWLKVQENMPCIVIGTRSAIFAPLFNLKLIVIDEEHDTSFKQQDHFRYHARDVALMRAKRLNIPVLLGSATPSLESWHNAQQKRYHLMTLTKRAGHAVMPSQRVIDLRTFKLNSGLSSPLIKAMQSHLEKQQQVMLFLNRRGFAPVMLCTDCGSGISCHRCSHYLTYHHHFKQLRCHHCQQQKPLPKACPDCHQPTLKPIGFGTEQIEEAVAKLFSDVPLIRIDRDTTSRRGSLEKKLSQIQKGEPSILIGTQMLAKGHHFPKVTLVGILGSDQGFYSSDFRGIERLAQLLVQVSGRAGRSSLPGEVILQTHAPEHPLLQTLLNEDYSDFANQLLQTRQKTQLPPFSYQALFRARAPNMSEALNGLADIKTQLACLPCSDVTLRGPVAAPMERRQGQYRAQLLLQSPSRKALQALLKASMHSLKSKSRQCHWSLDVDPVDLN